MTDIVVTLGKNDMEHLYEKTLDRGSFWIMGRLPKKLNVGEKVFVVCGGTIRGYFDLAEIDVDEPGGENMLVFGLWHPIHQILMKGFQGFRYRNFKYQKRWVESGRREGD